MATPQVMIRYSKDGGQTWSHEIWKDLVGADKRYLNRVKIGPIGSGYDYKFRVTCSENISFTLISAHADVEVGI